jgi:hypothetical protein
MIMDLLVGACCGLMAVCLFALHVISSPRRQQWPGLPEYVRTGLLVTGVAMTWRSVNLFTLPAPPAAPGHVNAEALFVGLALTYLLGALTFWAVRRYLPGKGHARLEWVEQQERASASALHPVMMTQRQLEQLARARGAHVNAEPPADHKGALH